MNRTLEQRRAAFALGFIEGQHGTDRERLMTHLHKLPVRVQTNGLGQALAFLMAEAGSNKNSVAGRLCGQLEDWLCGSRSDDRPCRVYPNGALMKQLVIGDRASYLRAQEETLLLGNWLKRFGEAYLG